MENKKTTELLDLIGIYSVKERNEKEITDKETQDYCSAMEELITRVPFNRIFSEYPSEEKKSLDTQITELKENSEDFEKKVRRHKHDEKTGDVMIRI